MPKHFFGSERTVADVSRPPSTIGQSDVLILFVDQSGSNAVSRTLGAVSSATDTVTQAVNPKGRDKSLTGFGFFSCLDTPKVSTGVVVCSGDKIHVIKHEAGCCTFCSQHRAGVLVCSNANALKCHTVSQTISLLAQLTGSTSHYMF